MTYQSFEDLWKEVEQTDSYHEQAAIIDFSVELHRLMLRRNLTKKDVAEHLGVSQAYVTKVFKGKANFTISSMVRLVRSLKGKLQIHVYPEEEGEVLWFRAINGKRQQDPPAPPVWGAFLNEESLPREGIGC